MKKKYTLRKLFNNVHLWMGLASGLILFIVCLSGTIYTFRAEIERWLSPSKYYVSAAEGSIALPADTLIARVEKQVNGKATAILIPDEALMTYQVTIKKQAEKTKAGLGDQTTNKEKTGEPRAGNTQAGKQSGDQKPQKKDGPPGSEGGARPKTYFVNPYTAAITGEQGGGTSDFFASVMQLHRWLMLETSVGRIIVGSATVIFVFLILSGLVLWFPFRLKNWKQGFTIKTKANWKRVNHDLHNTFGFYSFLLLLIMALTGLCWSFEWYKEGLSNVLGAQVFKGRAEKPLTTPVTDSASTVSIASIISGSNELFTYTGSLRIALPDDPASAIVITKNKTGFFAFSGADKVQYSRVNGEALKVERFADKPLNVKIADSIKPLHTGEIFGTFSKILYFIACLIATSLPVTGTMIWLNKFKKKPKNKSLRPRSREGALSEATA